MCKENTPVIIVDWKADAAGPDYYLAAYKTKKVGEKLAELIRNIGLDATSSVHCVGHSLGAHVCGFCGKVQLKRITGFYFCYSPGSAYC
jgi:hypothetical protein